MTNGELKDALLSCKPVVLRSQRYGEMRYKCVNAVIYTRGSSGGILVQAELLDYNGGSVTLAKASEVEYEDE